MGLGLVHIVGEHLGRWNKRIIQQVSLLSHWNHFFPLFLQFQLQLQK